MDTEKRVLTVEELARELGISRNLAYKQVREGKIFSIKCGDRYLIPVAALEKLLSGESQAPACTSAKASQK
jgi:excisionase family DNA binding protein